MMRTDDATMRADNDNMSADMIAHDELKTEILFVTIHIKSCEKILS